MKKNFLFATLTVLLAGFWFGGASLADHTDWEFMDWNDPFVSGYAGNHNWTQTGVITIVENNDITYSNVKLIDEGNARWDTVKNIWELWVLFFASDTASTASGDLTIAANTYYKTLDTTWFDVSPEGSSSEGWRWSAAYWIWITPDLVKNALANSWWIIENTFVISSWLDRTETYNVKIDVHNYTQYKAWNWLEDDNIFFQVVNGEVVIENWQKVNEIMRWEDFHTEDSSKYITQATIESGDNYMTFSGLKMNIIYPTEDPEDLNIAYVATLFFSAWDSPIFDWKTFTQQCEANNCSKWEKGDQRYHVAAWYRVSPDRVKAALETDDHNIVNHFTVTQDDKSVDYTVTINVDNVELISTGDSKTIFKVENWVITTIDWEDAVTVKFEWSDIKDEIVASGSNVVEPETPTKECNSFDGWFVDSAYSTWVEFPLTVTWDVTIYAKWTYTCSRSSGWGGGGSSKSSASSSNESKTAEKATDTADEQKADEAKADESKDGEVLPEGTVANEVAVPMTEAQAVAKFGQEQIDAYKWAHDKGITTMDTVEDARLDQPLTRAELAKMMVVYMVKIANKSPVVTGTVSYPDVKSEELGDLAGYIQLAYQFQIMGIDANGNPIDEFNPNGLVTRWEYATVFSRVLFGSLFNQEWEDFYSKHIAALNAAGILTNTDPTIQEMRGWVMLMMYRSSQNLEEIAKVAAEIWATDEEVEAGKKAAEILAEEEAKAETTTWDVAEAPIAEEQAEAATWDVAEVLAVEETASVEANTWEVAAEPSNN